MSYCRILGISIINFDFMAAASAAKCNQCLANDFALNQHFTIFQEHFSAESHFASWFLATARSPFSHSTRWFSAFRSTLRHFMCISSNDNSIWGSCVSSVVSKRKIKRVFKGFFLFDFLVFCELGSTVFASLLLLFLQFELTVEKTK